MCDSGGDRCYFAGRMNSLLSDVQSSLRFFARRKAAFLVLVATMALALGANTAVFSVLKAFVFARLAVPEPDRVVFVWTVRQLEGRGAVNFSDAHPNYLLLRATTHFWESLATTLNTDLNWQQDDGGAVRLQGVRANADFFKVMRVAPRLGRVFTAAEEGPKAAPVAVISSALWQNVFAGAPDVLGRTLRLNGVPHTIIGVLPAGFSQPQGTDVWLPFDLPENMWTLIIGGRQLNTYARLAPGKTVAAANAELRAFTPGAIARYPENKDWTWTVQPMREALLAGADNALVFVQVGAGVLLVLAVSNLVALLLAWAAERECETAVRIALGAGPWRIARLFLVQSLVLVTLGGIPGVALAGATLPALSHLNPNPALSAFLSGVRLDAATLGFAAALVLGTGLVVGLLPAWQARRTSFNEALRSGSRGASAGRAGLRWQQAMVVVQTAVAVLILTAAALAARGFLRLGRVELGFRTGNRMVFQIQFPEPAYATHEQRAGFVRALEQNLAREPAIRSFGFSSTIPVGDIQWGGGFSPQLPTGEFTPDPQVFHFRRVTPGYLATLGVPLLAGRMMDDRDRAGAPPIAVISRAAAEKYWPGVSAIGRKLRRAVPKDAPLVEVVGVVGNVRDAGAGFPAAETIYVPFDQVSLRRGWVVLDGDNPVELLAAGRRALRATAPDVAAYNAARLADLAWQANALPRLQMVLLGVFAAVAAGITALGSYGVMSQLVANRRREMAIRSALGATPAGVLRLVLGQNARLAAAGTALGLGAAWLSARWLQAKLTGFDAAAAWTYPAVALLVLGLTQLASLIPARRAARVDVPAALGGG